MLKCFPKATPRQSLARRDAVEGGEITRRGRRGADGHRSRGDDGITLVELLVAIAILTIILSAVAASLIAFSREAIASERRAQATALLNQVHEEFQAAPWDAVGTLPADFAEIVNEDEPLDALDPLRDRLTLPSDPDELPTLMSEEGLQDLVVTADVDAAIPVYWNPTIDERDYEVYRFVTWVDRTGDGAPDIKRLTAIVRWDVLARSYEQEFVSERAPTVRESGEFGRPRLIQFDIFPLAFLLSRTTDAGGGEGVFTDRVEEDATTRLAVRFSDPVRDVRVEFERIDTVLGGVASLGTMTEPFGSPVIGGPEYGTYFVIDGLELDDHRFTWGPRPFRIFATPEVGDEFQAGSRNVRFYCDLDPGSDEPEACGEPQEIAGDIVIVEPALLAAGEDPEGSGGGGSGAVEVGAVLLQGSNQRNVRPQGAGGNYRLCNSLEVTASLIDQEPEDSVELSWVDPLSGEPQATTMDVFGNMASHTFPTSNQQVLREDVGETSPVEFKVEVLRGGVLEGQNVSELLSLTGVASC